MTGVQTCALPISSRLYSDLFVTMIWDDDREKILKYVKETSMGFSSQQGEIYPSCNLRLSAGIYYLSDREENLEGAIENANIARKSMKGGTEYCRVYESRMRKQREKEKEVLSQFQDNLVNGRFQVYIQPKFLLSKFELFGGEALVRLQKQDGSLEPPGVFIPILEKSG